MLSTLWSPIVPSFLLSMLFMYCRETLVLPSPAWHSPLFQECCSLPWYCGAHAKWNDKTSFPLFEAIFTFQVLYLRRELFAKGLVLVDRSKWHWFSKARFWRHFVDFSFPTKTVELNSLNLFSPHPGDLLNLIFRDWPRSDDF